ncbi:two-component system response regulator [Leptospira hartskeerlii]|uniref:Two-component system response regulator n=1 Tax=Leptospira hartskeerlii TaxID=2023177 RepID=A0A2M9X8K2_9LEPT|nr:response regulator [Leptospira hartskeerlii]PJZ24028.1 two-component system response regulator [Leptospira hartskeerlii]PJZ32094.1 two-component system response regulator [Leptospira hartskeerlii]
MAPKVLVVDDNIVNLKLICELLELDAYEVLKAGNAEEALQVIENFSLDLILMDIELPGVDGLTLTRQLKERENTKNIPIIAVTAFAMKGDAQKAYGAGCDGYITKPIDTRKFTEQINGFIKGLNQ